MPSGIYQHKPHSEERKANMRKPHLMIKRRPKHSEETKRKIGEGHRGKILSKETKQKISEALRGEKSYRWKGGGKKRGIRSEKRKLYEKEYKRKWKNTERGREIINFHRKKWRAKKMGSVGSHSVDDWKKLKIKYKNCCLCCGRQEPFTDLYYQYLTEDHIIPISKGGINSIDNIQPLCILCNNKKKISIIDFRKL